MIEHKYKLKNLSSWLHYSFRNCFFIFFISDIDKGIFLTSKGKNLERKQSRKKSIQFKSFYNLYFKGAVKVDYAPQNLRKI